MHFKLTQILKQTSMLLIIIFATSCSSPSSILDGLIDDLVDENALVGTWNTTNMIVYDDTCTGDEQASYWTSINASRVCNATTCDDNITFSCTGSDNGGTDPCSNHYTTDVTESEFVASCKEISYTLTGSTVVLTSNSYCDDCVSVDKTTCENQTCDENESCHWYDAMTETGTVTGNTMVTTIIRDEYCYETTWTK